MTSLITQYQATRQGGPFARVRIPQHQPNANEVSVLIKAIGLNPLDTYQFFYGFRVEKWPLMLGSDASGVVEAVGDDVTAFAPGDEVFGNFIGGMRGAAFQEVAVTLESRLARKPERLSWEECASLPVVYLTAASAVHHSLKIRLPFLPALEDAFSPKSILILGGSSAVGASAIQLLGLALPDATILATASSKHHAHVRSLGAEVVLDYKSANVVDDIIAASPNDQGVEAILDAVGSAAQQTSIFEVLRRDGPRQYARVETGAKIVPPEDVQHHQVFMRPILGVPGSEQLMPALARMLELQEFELPVAVKTVGRGFDALDKALLELEGGVSGTKLVVSV